MNSVSRGLARAGLSALQISQLYRPLVPLTGGLGVVLLLHRVRPRVAGPFRPGAAFEITPDFLGKVVARLRRRNLDIVPLDEAVRRVETPKKGRRFAVLTIDGGHADNFEHAYPLLRSLNCPFAVFLASGLIDREVTPWWAVLEAVIARQDTIAVSFDGPVSYFDCRSTAAKRAAFSDLDGWLRELDEERRRQAVDELAWRYGIDTRGLVDRDMMTWDQVRTLADDPLVTIGTQTIDHHYLARLPEERVRAEIRDGARVLEAVTGRAPAFFAYPFGDRAAAGPREYRIVAELGFKAGLTAIPGVVRKRLARRPMAWPRIAVDGRYQSLRYIDMLISGLPFLTVRNPPPAERPKGQQVRAAASSG